MRVHDAGDGAVVDMAIALFDVLNCCDGFFFGFVREHRAKGAVTNDADVGKFGAVLLVDYEAAFVVDFEADIFEAEASSIGAAADGDKDNICVELMSDLVENSEIS